jgi:hypothetical protein
MRAWRLSFASIKRPWRLLGAGALHHIVDRQFVVGPTLAVAPVLVGQLPGFVGDLLAFLEAPQLLVWGDVQPEFQQHDAAFHQLRFEIVDLGIGALPFAGAGEALDPLYQHPPVPTAVINGDPAGARQVPPESPEVIMRGFFVGGRSDLDHLIVAGIQRGGDAANAAALARGVPALKDQNGGNRLSRGVR